MQLRLTNFDAKGAEVLTIWDFLPLRDKRQAPQYLRDDRTASDGSPVRRPYAEQNVRLVTFGAGLLLQSDAQENFLKFQRAHKIEFPEVIKGKHVWTEYAPSIESQIELQSVEDIDELAWCEIKFIEKLPRYYHEWAK